MQVNEKARWALARKLYEARYPTRGGNSGAAHWDAMPKSERSLWVAVADASLPDPRPRPGAGDASGVTVNGGDHD